MKTRLTTPEEDKVLESRPYSMYNFKWNIIRIKILGKYRISMKHKKLN